MESNYQFIDCGDGGRLEQFGRYKLARPSSLAIWKRRFPARWTSTDGSYDHESGWQHKVDREDWVVEIAGCQLQLRLQRNGQIGLFPEHASYMQNLRDAVQASISRSGSAKVLNLFAYTGMATVVAAQAGASVTHIDLLKPCLDWARTNLELNAIPSDKVRLIPEEALTFMEREVKRGNRYDVLVIDPPGFSRITKQKSWSIDDVLPSLSELISDLTMPKSEIFFTCHGSEHGSTTMSNLLFDQFGPKIELEEKMLTLGGEDIPTLPAGYLVHGKIS